MEPVEGDDGLPRGAARVAIAGPIEAIDYPAICPACGAGAGVTIAIDKPFRFNNGADDATWQYRITRATPLFCSACAQEHRSSRSPITVLDHLRSALSLASVVPAAGLSWFAVQFFHDGPAAAGLTAALLAIVSLALGWWQGRRRRIPAPTRVSSAFDFGDDDSSAFSTQARTYAFARADYAAAFLQLNASRSAGLLSPARRRRQRALQISLVGLAFLGLSLAHLAFGQGRI